MPEGTDRAGVRLGIARLHHPVQTLGPGRRAGVWFQGCSIGCAGCLSRDTWATAAPADLVPLAAVTRWFDGLPAESIDGVTISGGEPFDQPEALGELTAWLRDRFDPERVDILVYTGYTLRVVTTRHAHVLANIDAVVTEPFRQGLGSPPRWRGSANQPLVPLTRLGRRLYDADRDAPAGTGLQVDVSDERIRLIGIPRPGDLQRIEAGLAARGVALDDCSWNA